MAVLLTHTAIAQWVTQSSGTTASLRGISAASDNVVWASGTQGTFLKTLEGGATWQAGTVDGAGKLDFRAIHAFDARNAYLMTAGPGHQSRIYRTTDGGARWQLQHENSQEKASSTRLRSGTKSAGSCSAIQSMETSSFSPPRTRARHGCPPRPALRCKRTLAKAPSRPAARA